MRALALLILGCLALVLGNQAPLARAALPAPVLVAPPEGALLPEMGVTLEWRLPEGARQVHLQVVPAKNDGPGVDLLLGPLASFTIPPPPGWYGLLPDMSYTWSVRVSDAATPVPPDDPSWSPWAQRTFRTPVVSSGTIGLVSPSQGAIVPSLTPLLQWKDSRSDLFLYEVQVSKDPDFGVGLSGAWAPVAWEVVHGGLSRPPTSYQVRDEFPLRDNTPYYWRVRPRVQGDGRPVGWSFAFTFETLTAAGRPAPAPTPIPTSTPAPRGKIAFVSSRDGNPEIYVMSPDGKEQTRLTDHPAADILPVWSPDGAKIAFGSNRSGKYEVYIMDADGVRQTRLTENESGVAPVAWSPDGTRIAFWKFERDFPNSEIYVMNADGSGLTRLTNDPYTDIRPVWSPDGTRIAFVSSRDGNLEVYVMHADGSAQVRLTDDPTSDNQPAWSPDGTRIAFVSERDGNQEIYVMRADGSAQTRLTQTFVRDQDPLWSPGGARIVYECGSFICVMNPDGSRSLRLTPSLGGGHPSWSPDGRKLAYECDTSICVINADGSARTSLTDDEFTHWDPAWSPR